MKPSTEAYADAPCEVDADFCLINTGDSMINARIFDGDTVYIKQQDIVENGELAAFIFNGEARIGRFQKGEDYVSFTPANPQYRSIILFGKDINKAQIVGKAVAFTSIIK